MKPILRRSPWLKKYVDEGEPDASFAVPLRDFSADQVSHAASASTDDAVPRSCFVESSRTKLALCFFPPCSYSPLFSPTSQKSAALALGVLHVKNLQDFETKLSVAAKENVPVVVKFTAKWCKPCQAIAPEFERLAAAHGKAKKAVFLEVDFDAQKAVRKLCKVRSLPTFQIYKAMKPSGELVGANKDKLVQLVNDAL